MPDTSSPPEEGQPMRTLTGAFVDSWLNNARGPSRIEVHVNGRIMMEMTATSPIVSQEEAMAMLVIMYGNPSRFPVRKYFHPAESAVGESHHNNSWISALYRWLFSKRIRSMAMEMTVKAISRTIDKAYANHLIHAVAYQELPKIATEFVSSS